MNRDQSNEKYGALIDNLLLNLSIFKKVFYTSRKKKSVISKVYGWDDIFAPVFFIDEEFKPNLKKA